MYSSIEGKLTISTSDGHKTITLVADDNKKIIIDDIELATLNYNETHLLSGEDNNERVIPLIIKSAKILNSEALFEEFNENKELKKINITTKWSLKFIAITVGGWLPAGMTPQNAHYLLDKNIFNILANRYTEGKIIEDIQNDFFDLIHTEELILNPSLFMLEGNNQSIKRTMSDIVDKFLESEAIIKKALPKAIIPETQENLTKGVFGMLEQLYDNNQKILTFIQSTMSILYKETAIKKRKDTVDQLKKIAIINGIRRESILYIAVLSAALSSPEQNYAKKILKPKPPKKYTLKDAYNALSDIRALDYLMWAVALDPKVKTYLCTNDKNLVRFWCAIEPTNLKFQGNRLSYNLRFRQNLFKNLSDSEFDYVINSIK